jgi:hypothetical protein
LETSQNFLQFHRIKQWINPIPEKAFAVGHDCSVERTSVILRPEIGITGLETYTHTVTLRPWRDPVIKNREDLHKIKDSNGSKHGREAGGEEAASEEAASEEAASEEAASEEAGCKEAGGKTAGQGGINNLALALCKLVPEDDPIRLELEAAILQKQLGKR